MSRLEIDRQARTISGRAVPWNVVSAISFGGSTLFPEGCLTWSGPVQLLIRHDKSLPVGRAISFRSAVDGLYAIFQVRRGDHGDRALALAELGWGLSIGLDQVDYDLRGNVHWCLCGELIEVSLLPDPAYTQENYVTVNSGLPVEGAPEGGLIEEGDDTLAESQEGELVGSEEYGESFAEESETPPVLEDGGEQSTKDAPEPPEFISEANRIQIEQTGEALETFTGRTLTREDLEAYNQAQLEKG